MGNVVLDDKFYVCFKFISKLTRYLGSSRVHFEPQRVTPVSSRYRMYSWVCVSLVTISAIFYARGYYLVLHEATALTAIFIFGTIMQYIFYLTNILMIRYSQRESNIKIFYMLNELNETLDLDANDYYCEFQRRRIIGVLMVLFVGFGPGYVLHSLELFNLKYTVLTLGVGFGALTIYIDLTIGVTMFYFLTIRIYAFNCLMKYSIKPKIKLYENKTRLWSILSSTSWLRYIAVPDKPPITNMLACEKWLECVQQMINCYNVIKDLISFPILSTTMMVIFWTLIVISEAILIARNRFQTYSPFATFLLCLWALSYYCVLTVAAIFSDWCHRELSKTKSLCIQVMACHHEESYRKIAGRTLRALHNTKLTFSVYGIFVLDSKLALTALGIIFSNIVVVVARFY